jgi:hypothetical protein
MHTRACFLEGANKFSNPETEIYLVNTMNNIIVVIVNVDLSYVQDGMSFYSEKNEIYENGF